MIGRGNSAANKAVQFKKGVSGFKGRKHTEETKAKMRKLGYRAATVTAEVMTELETLRKENQVLKVVVGKLIIKYGVDHEDTNVYT